MGGTGGKSGGGGGGGAAQEQRQEMRGEVVSTSTNYTDASADQGEMMEAQGINSTWRETVDNQGTMAPDGVGDSLSIYTPPAGGIRVNGRGAKSHRFHIYNNRGTYTLTHASD